MSCIREVHPNLVRAPGLQTATNQGASMQKLDGFEMCDRPFPALSFRRELLSVRGVARVEGVVCGRWGRLAPDDGQVRSLQAVRLEHVDETLVSRLGFRHHHHPTGVLVEAMNDARPQRIGAPLNFRVVEQRVDERPVGMTGRGVDHQARGFVEHEEVVVLEKHIG